MDQNLFRHDNVFFSSDWHLCHERVIGFDNRPFKDLAEMHETIINNHNSVVKEDDHFFFLGDITHKGNPSTIKHILSQLNGKMYLILGNHDKERDYKHYKGRFEWIEKLYDLQIEDSDIKRGHQHIVLCHYAFAIWNRAHHGSWMIHGHSHQKFKPTNGLIVDVGCNGWNYTPVSYQQVKDYMRQRVFIPVDHHRTPEVKPNDQRDWSIGPEI